MDNLSTRREMNRERRNWNLLLPCTVRWSRDEARELQFQVNKMNRITNSYSTLPTPGKIFINFWNDPKWFPSGPKSQKLLSNGLKHLPQIISIDY